MDNKIGPLHASPFDPPKPPESKQARPISGTASYLSNKLQAAGVDQLSFSAGAKAAFQKLVKARDSSTGHAFANVTKVVAQRLKERGVAVTHPNVLAKAIVTDAQVPKLDASTVESRILMAFDEQEGALANKLVHEILVQTLDPRVKGEKGVTNPVWERIEFDARGTAKFTEKVKEAVVKRALSKELDSIEENLRVAVGELFQPVSQDICDLDDHKQKAVLKKAIHAFTAAADKQGAAFNAFAWPGFKAYVTDAAIELGYITR